MQLTSSPWLFLIAKCTSSMVMRLSNMASRLMTMRMIHLERPDESFGSASASGASIPAHSFSMR